MRFSLLLLASCAATAMARPIRRDGTDLFPGDPNPKAVGFYTFEYELAEPDMMCKAYVAVANNIYRRGGSAKVASSCVVVDQGNKIIAAYATQYRSDGVWDQTKAVADKLGLLFLEQSVPPCQPGAKQIGTSFCTNPLRDTKEKPLPWDPASAGATNPAAQPTNPATQPTNPPSGSTNQAVGPNANAPGGNAATTPGGNAVTTPGGNAATTPAGPTQVTGPNATTPGGTTQVADPNATTPGGATQAADPNATATQGNTNQTVDPNATMTQETNQVADPNATVPDGLDQADDPNAPPPEGADPSSQSTDPGAETNPGV